VDRAAEIQEEYTAIDSLTVTAEVTADYGDRVYEFRLKYTGDDEEGTVEILSPESVKGIAARLTSGGRALRYDGAELSLGSLTKDGLSPMECLPFMIGRWKNGYVSGAVTEKLDGTDTVAVTFDVSENESLVTWFEADSSLPVRAELFFDGDMVIRCEFENIIT
jgi:hypothetical protein